MRRATIPIGPLLPLEQDCMALDPREDDGASLLRPKPFVHPELRHRPEVSQARARRPMLGTSRPLRYRSLAWARLWGSIVLSRQTKKRGTVRGMNAINSAIQPSLAAGGSGFPPVPQQ